MPGGVVREPDASDRHSIRESFARLGNKSSVARETGWHRATVARVLETDEPGQEPESVTLADIMHEAAQYERKELFDRAALLGTLRSLGLAPLADAVSDPPSPAPEQPPAAQAIPTHSGLYRVDKPYRKIAVLSDLHIPYHDVRNLEVAIRYLEDWRPDLVVLNGDIFDCYSISRFSKHPDRRECLQDEFDIGRPWLKRIDAIETDQKKPADVYAGEGNHDYRLMRHIMENPGFFKLRALEFRNAAELPSRWTWLANQYHLRIGSLSIVHGDIRGGGGGKYCAANLLARLKSSVIHGHFHRSQSYWEPDYEGNVRAGWGSGHLADVNKAEDYTVCPQWSPGFVTIDRDPESGLFEVRQHLTANGYLRAGGKTYAA
jgi:predicted phosphodiesterase